MTWQIKENKIKITITLLKDYGPRITDPIIFTDRLKRISEFHVCLIYISTVNTLLDS